VKKAFLATLSLIVASCAVPSQPITSAIQTVPVPVPADQTGVFVAGHGEMPAAPDTAIVDLGVSIVRPTVAEANTAAAELAQAVIDSVREHGVAGAEIQTTYLSVYPEWQYKDGENTVIGYRATNNLLIRVRQVEAVSDIIDSAVAAGGDNVTLNGIRFEIEDDAQLLREARAAAWADAAAKANQLAELSGLTLGRPVFIDETVVSPYPIYFGAGGGQGDGGTPVEPGSVTVSVDLTVRFQMAE